MSSLGELLTLVSGIAPENRQALIICLTNRAGPAKFPLTSDFGAGGLVSSVNSLLDGMEPEHRTRRTAELLNYLAQKHGEWMLGMAEAA